MKNKPINISWTHNYRVRCISNTARHSPPSRSPVWRHYATNMQLARATHDIHTDFVGKSHGERQLGRT
jgi:hypothetical protein